MENIALARVLEMHFISVSERIVRLFSFNEFCIKDRAPTPPYSKIELLSLASKVLKMLQCVDERFVLSNPNASSFSKQSNKETALPSARFKFREIFVVAVKFFTLSRFATSLYSVTVEAENEKAPFVSRTGIDNRFKLDVIVENVVPLKFTLHVNVDIQLVGDAGVDLLCKSLLLKFI